MISLPRVFAIAPAKKRLLVQQLSRACVYCVSIDVKLCVNTVLTDQVAFVIIVIIIDSV